MRRQLLPALGMVAGLIVLLGLVYPLMITGIAQAAFPGAADASLVRRDGEVVGSALLGQAFEGAEYFQPRPSAAGDGYDGAASAASNLGPTNDDLAASVAERVAAYRKLNGLDADQQVPVDAVTASGSGLDPHISVANAELQAARVATERGLELDRVQALIVDATDGRDLGVLGEPGVNVLQLNVALDAAGR